MDETILKESDLLESSHQLVVYAIGFYDGGSGFGRYGFPRLVKELSAGHGYGYNDKGINFWDELDEYDQTHEGRFDVECYLMDDSCKLTYAEFYHYMELACERYASRFPDSKEGLLSALDAYKERFL